MTQNIDGTAALLEAMHRAGEVETLLYADSANEFDRPMSLPIDESHPLTSHNPYEFSKAAELAVRSWHRVYGVQRRLQGWEYRWWVSYVRDTGEIYAVPRAEPPGRCSSWRSSRRIQWMRATGSRFSRSPSTMWWPGLPELGIAA